MKCKNALFLCVLALYSGAVLASDIEVPLFVSVEEKIQQSQEEKAKTSTNKRSSRRTPNIGKGAKPVEEIKIAPDPVPAIRIKSAEIQEIGAPFDNRLSSLNTVSEESPSPNVSFEPIYEAKDIKVLPKQEKKEEPKDENKNSSKKEEKKRVATTVQKNVIQNKEVVENIQVKQKTIPSASQNIVSIPKLGMPTNLNPAMPDVQAPHIAEGFDIMGMKLHMTPEEVITIAQDNGFEVSNIAYAIPLFMTTTYEQQCRQNGFAQLRLIHDCVRMQAQADEVYYISELRLNNDVTKEQIIVSFVSGLTGNQASRIDYTSFGDNSLGTSYKDAAKKTARQDLFWKLVFEKYGQPNFPKRLLWGDPRKIYMQAFMEGSALNGRLILDDKDLPYQDMEAAGKINDTKEVPHSFSFVKDTQEMY